MNEKKQFLVLILDDDDLFRQFSKFIIEKHLKIEVVGCKNPEEAFKFMDERVPDLILLDMEMPVMDGYKFLLRLRSDNKFENVHVIPCTALASKELFASLLKLGIDDYILKPPTDKVLVSKVKRVFEFWEKKNKKDSSSSNDITQEVNQ